MRGKVILFYPPYDGPPLSAPLCLLTLAATLRESDFEAVVIDAAIEPDYKRRILREASSALCLGISVLTGPMIRGAIEVSHAIKEQLSGIAGYFWRLASQSASGGNPQRAVRRCGRPRARRDHLAAAGRGIKRPRTAR